MPLAAPSLLPSPLRSLISPCRGRPRLRARLIVPPLFLTQPIAGETHERSS